MALTEVEILENKPLVMQVLAETDPLLAEFFRKNILAPSEKLDLFKNLRSLSYALKDRDPIPWIVAGLIAPSSVNIIVADSGAKKSWVILDLVTSISQGKKWLGFDTKQNSILWINEDMGEYDLLERIKQSFPGKNDDDLYILDNVSHCGLDLRRKDHINYISERIKTKKYGVVILDAMADFIPGADENTAKDITPVFLALRKIAENAKCAIIILHHTNKMNGYRGSTDIKSKVDLMLMLDSKPETNKVSFRTEKVRNGKPISFFGECIWEDGKFFMVPTMGFKNDIDSVGAEYVIRYLTENGQSSRKNIISNPDTCESTSANSAIYKLVNQKRIYRINPEEKGRNSEAIYALCNPIDPSP
jgi:hypothetical protein